MNTNPSEEEARGELTVHCENGSYVQVVRCISHWSNPNEDNGAPLMKAVARGSLQITLELLNAGAIPDLDNAACLLIAINNNNDAIASLLLKYGSSIPDDGDIYHIAMRKGLKHTCACMEAKTTGAR